jgi:hypothetical protein
MGLSYPMYSKYNRYIIHYRNGIALRHNLIGNDHSTISKTHNTVIDYDGTVDETINGTTPYAGTK